MADAQRVIQAAASNPYFKAAVESNPAYVHAMGIRAIALAAQRDYPPAAAPLSPLHTDGALDDWLNSMVIAQTAERDRQTSLLQLEELVRDCDNQIAGVLIAPDPLLTLVAADFDELMDEVRTALPGLKGATDPTEAINLGAADHWKNLYALRVRYDDIRAAQSLVIDGDDLGRQYRQSAKSSYLTDRGIDDPLASDLAIANLDDLWPSWRKPAAFGLDTRPVDGRPWPSEPVQQLVWLASGNAEPWVPTLGELDALAVERKTAANPNPRVYPGITPAPINSPRVINKPIHQVH